MRVFALILALCPSLLSAQNLAERLSRAAHISYSEWQSLTDGKTVVYEIDGSTFGYETYRGNGNVTIRLANGSCIDGTWAMQDSAFCFDWEDGPFNCFHHKRDADSIYVIGLDNGVETGDIQRVSRIANIPLACGPALLSALIPEVSR